MATDYHKPSLIFRSSPESLEEHLKRSRDKFVFDIWIECFDRKPPGETIFEHSVIEVDAVGRLRRIRKSELSKLYYGAQDLDPKSVKCLGSVHPLVDVDHHTAWLSVKQCVSCRFQS